MNIQIKTERKRQIIDLTDPVQDHLPRGGSGLAAVTALHSTVAVTTANLDPGTDIDLLDALDALVPDGQWIHPHDPSHAPDHLLASIIGPSVSLPVDDGRLVLGTWQRLVLVEFDGPGSRDLRVTFVSS